MISPLLSNTINNRRLLQIRAIVPIVVMAFWIWASVYHHGYYLEVTGNMITEIPIPEGVSVQVGSDPLPDGYKIEVLKDKIILTEPLPSGTVIHMAWKEAYLVSRQINIATNTILSPIGNAKLLMLNAENITSNLGVILTISEFGFYLLDRNKPTILSIYRISIINIRIQTSRIFDKSHQG